MSSIFQLIKKCFRKEKKSPFVIIKKEQENANSKEYNSIEEAITELESDPNISAESIEKLKTSLKNLKNKSSIKIKNGEILK